MLFWIIVTVLALAVGLMLATPLWRGARGTLAQPDVAIYRDQLAEVDRDMARGVLDGEEAARTRAEVARRLLAADKAGPTLVFDAPSGPSRWMAAVVALVVAGGTGALYWGLGAPGYDDLPRAARLEAAATALETRMSQAEGRGAGHPATARGPAGRLPRHDRATARGGGRAAR